MRVGPSTGHTKRYLYFRCDNDSCSRKKRSIRAKIVVDFISDILQNGINFSEAEYKKYLDKMTIIGTRKREEVRGELHNREGVLKRISGEIRERSLQLVGYNEASRVWEENTKRVEYLQREEGRLKSDISKLKESLPDPESDRLSIEQFLNLSKNAGKIVQSANEVIKDQIVRLIFLNFFVDEEKVTSYRLKEPFATLIKQREFLPGGGGGN